MGGVNVVLALTSSITQIHGHGSLEDSIAVMGRAFGVY